MTIVTYGEVLNELEHLHLAKRANKINENYTGEFDKWMATPVGIALGTKPDGWICSFKWSRRNDTMVLTSPRAVAELRAQYPDLVVNPFVYLEATSLPSLQDFAEKAPQESTDEPVDPYSAGVANAAHAAQRRR